MLAGVRCYYRNLGGGFVGLKDGVVKCRVKDRMKVKVKPVSMVSLLGVEWMWLIWESHLIELIEFLLLLLLLLCLMVMAGLSGESFEGLVSVSQLGHHANQTGGVVISTFIFIKVDGQLARMDGIMGVDFGKDAGRERGFQTARDAPPVATRYSFPWQPVAWSRFPFSPFLCPSPVVSGVPVLKQLPGGLTSVSWAMCWW